MAISPDKPLNQVLAGARRGLSFAEAQVAILATAPAMAPQPVPLTQADGRTLSTALIAQRDQPATALSAMDGYAIRVSDLGAGP